MACPLASLCRRDEQAAELGAGIVVGDVRHPGTYEAQMAGCDCLIILTSAVPKMRPRDNPSDPPEFYFEPDEMPEQARQCSTIFAYVKRKGCIYACHAELVASKVDSTAKVLYALPHCRLTG